MVTMFAMYIEAEYGKEYEDLYIGTVLVDFAGIFGTCIVVLNVLGKMF